MLFLVYIYGLRETNTLISFLEHIEHTLDEHRGIAQIGGVPDIGNKIKAFLRIKFRAYGRFPANLDVGFASLNALNG